MKQASTERPTGRQHLLSLVRGEIRGRVRRSSVAATAADLGLSRHVILTLASGEAEPREGSLYLAAARLGIAI